MSSNIKNTNVMVKKWFYKLQYESFHLALETTLDYYIFLSIYCHAPLL